MSEKRYAIYGKVTPKMLDRAKVFDRIRRNQLKQTPDHLSVIAPPLFGKTVLMSHVADFFRKDDSPYLAVVHWDMRHETPTNDQQFMDMLASQIKERVAAKYPEEVADIVTGESAYTTLQYVAVTLGNEGKKVLVVMDGFDYALQNEGLSRGLFNNLRKLAETSSLCLLTASTAPLRELCQSEDARSSDFWNLFADTVVTLGPLGDDDWTAMVEPLSERKVTLEKAAMTELRNWCGNHPLLAILLLAAIDRMAADNASITSEQMDAAAESLLQETASYGMILAVWQSCTPELQAALSVMPCDGLAPAAVPSSDLTVQLESRGLVRKSDKGLRGSRLMERISKSRAPAIDTMRELFGDTAQYQRNMRLALEMRLKCLTGVDLSLCGAVAKAIRELDPQPEYVLTWARTIATRALHLIWKAELGNASDLPVEWTTQWKHAGMTKFDVRLPYEPGKQCRLLRMIVGDGSVPRVAKVVSKQTALLVNFLQSVGDYGQHQDGEVVGSFGTSVCHAAVELCETLSADLKRASAGAK
jgi:hypothetical protein